MFALLYFGVQRLRGGVTPSLIREASDLLEGPGEAIERHCRQRLAALHGLDGPALSWLDRQPVTSRDELQGLARAYAVNKPRVPHEWRKTSGSTGTPFRMVRDMQLVARMDAAMWAVYGWHGIGPGMPHARFWGAPLARLGRARMRATDSLLHRKRMDAFALSRKRAAAFFQRLRAFRPVYAYGYPSLIRAFVEQCMSAGFDGRDLQLRVLISTGELLNLETRRALENFFGCPVVNEYGCTEDGIIGFECEEGAMHLIPVAAYPEIIDTEGNPAAPGETGGVVVTDLYGRLMPLVRYRLHDRGEFREPAGCGCGRPLRQVSIDLGRTDDFIQTPERGPVYDAILAYTVPDGVQRFRAFQLAIDHLSVELVPGSGFDADRTPAECQKRWETALGPGMKVTTRTVDDIPHQVSGKLRYFVPLDLGDTQDPVE